MSSSCLIKYPIFAFNAQQVISSTIRYRLWWLQLHSEWELINQIFAWCHIFLFVEYCLRFRLGNSLRDAEDFRGIHTAGRASRARWPNVTVYPILVKFRPGNFKLLHEEDILVFWYKLIYNQFVHSFEKVWIGLREFREGSATMEAFVKVGRHFFGYFMLTRFLVCFMPTGHFAKALWGDVHEI